MNDVDMCTAIKRIIKRRGLKQKFIADKAGFTERDFSRMLTGSKPIRAEYLPAIAKALEVEINELFDN